MAGRTLTLNCVEGRHLMAVTAVTGIKFNSKFTAAKLSLQPELSPASILSYVSSSFPHCSRGCAVGRLTSLNLFQLCFSTLSRHTSSPEKQVQSQRALLCILPAQLIVQKKMVLSHQVTPNTPLLDEPTLLLHERDFADRASFQYLVSLTYANFKSTVVSGWSCWIGNA
jgi:hypothetical protein